MQRTASLIIPFSFILLLIILIAELPLPSYFFLFDITEHNQQALISQNFGSNQLTVALLSYRGMDTLTELAILLAITTISSLLLGGNRRSSQTRPLITDRLQVTGIFLLIPVLLMSALYLILYGHRIPGGGFQGGGLLGIALFLPILTQPTSRLYSELLLWLDSLSGIILLSLALIGLFLFNGFFLLTQTEQWSFILLPCLSFIIGIKVGTGFAILLQELLAFDPDFGRIGYDRESNQS